MTEKKKVYSLRLPDDGIVGKWISNQKTSRLQFLRRCF